jgi:hypothetical protein
MYIYTLHYTCACCQKEAPSNRRRQHHAFMHADAGAAYRTWNRSHTHRISNSSRRTGGANWHPRRSTDPSISTIYVCRGRGTAGQGGRSRDPFWAPLSRAIEERGFSDRDRAASGRAGVTVPRRPRVGVTLTGSAPSICCAAFGHGMPRSLGRAGARMPDPARPAYSVGLGHPCCPSLSTFRDAHPAGCLRCATYRWRWAEERCRIC